MSRNFLFFYSPFLLQLFKSPNLQIPQLSLRMDEIDVAVEKLRCQIHEVESQLTFLKLQLTKLEQSALSNPAPPFLSASQPNVPPDRPIASTARGDWRWPLDAEEYKRYGRQMIVPEIGLEGCIHICSSPQESRS